MIACFLYNAVNIAAWCALACHFGHWWIALFSIATQLTYRERKKESEANEND